LKAESELKTETRTKKIQSTNPGAAELSEAKSEARNPKHEKIQKS